jgi:hypothetical protein
MFVPSGSFLTWVGQFAAWSFDTLSLDDAMVQVSAYLKNNYNIVVTDYSDTLAGSLGAGTVTVSLQSNMDRGDTGADDGVADVKSNVDDAFAHINTYGYTPPNLTGSTCNLTATQPTDGGGGPTYSFSIKNLLPSWLGGSPVTADQQAQYTAQGTAQINSVATNAAAASGVNSTAAQVAREAAIKQAAAFNQDEANLAKAQNKAAASSDQWILYGLIAAVVLVGAVVALPYISAARGVTR